MKKALKTLFPGKKAPLRKNRTRKLLFLKTLAVRTVKGKHNKTDQPVVTTYKISFFELFLFTLNLLLLRFLCSSEKVMNIKITVQNYRTCFQLQNKCQGGFTLCTTWYQLQIRNKVATFGLRLHSLCFPCIHNQFPIVFRT